MSFSYNSLGLYVSSIHTLLYKLVINFYISMRSLLYISLLLISIYLCAPYYILDLNNINIIIKESKKRELKKRIIV